MATYNKQLKAFYKAQGLQGKHLRSALKYDRRRVRVESETSRFTAPNALSHLFLFSESREGHRYWMVRDDA